MMYKTRLKFTFVNKVFLVSFKAVDHCFSFGLEEKRVMGLNFEAFELQWFR